MTVAIVTFTVLTALHAAIACCALRTLWPRPPRRDYGEAATDSDDGTSRRSTRPGLCRRRHLR